MRFQKSIFSTAVLLVATLAGVAAAQDYVVKKGDTMWAIAMRYHVSLKALEAANPQIANPNLIFPGQVIHIPSPPSVPPIPKKKPTPKPPAPAPAPSPGLVPVAKGSGPEIDLSTPLRGRRSPRGAASSKARRSTSPGSGS